MSPEWASVAVVAGIAVLSFAVNYGMFGRAIKDHDRRLDSTEKTKASSGTKSTRSTARSAK
jgi:hypothetical protein